MAQALEFEDMIVCYSQCFEHSLLDYKNRDL